MQVDLWGVLHGMYVHVACGNVCVTVTPGILVGGRSPHDWVPTVLHDAPMRMQGCCLFRKGEAAAHRRTPLYEVQLLCARIHGASTINTSVNSTTRVVRGPSLAHSCCYACPRRAEHMIAHDSQHRAVQTTQVWSSGWVEALPNCAITSYPSARRATQACLS